MRENVRTYQELERTLESVKRRMAKLDEIENFHKEAVSFREKDEMYEYFLAQANRDITGEEVQALREQIETGKNRLSELKKELQGLTKEKDPLPGDGDEPSPGTAGK